MRRHRALAVLLAGTLVAACGRNGAADDTSGPGPAQAPAPMALAEAETVATGLEIPWALAFVDADTLLVTERPGRVRVVRGGQVDAQPALELDVRHVGEGGLLGIALHPEFPDERFAYLYSTTAADNRVTRFRVAEDLRLHDEEVLLEGIPAARVHNGGSIAFGPDGLLYITTGDAQDPDLSADPSSLAGKFLRIAPDGGIPAGNPFEGSPVFSYGHRNPQGFDWDDAGNLYASEHGPSGEFGMCCHDELNLVRAGEFYGWPYRAGGVSTGEGEPPTEPNDPVAASAMDTWAPAGVAVRSLLEGGSQILMAGLRGEQLLRFVASAEDPALVSDPETALDGFGRLRAIVTGPDGCLYLTTSNTDGRGDRRAGDDRILRACFQ